MGGPAADRHGRRRADLLADPGRRAAARGDGQPDGVSLPRPVLGSRRASPGGGSARPTASSPRCSLLLPLSVPSERWPLLSLPRFGLVVFPLFLALAALAARRPRLHTAIVAISALLLGVAVVQWATGSGSREPVRRPRRRHDRRLRHAARARRAGRRTCDRALRGARSRARPTRRSARRSDAEIAYYRAHKLEGADAESARRAARRCAAAFLDELGSTSSPHFARRVRVRVRRHRRARASSPCSHALRARGLALAVVANWDVGLHGAPARARSSRARFDAVVVVGRGGSGEARPATVPRSRSSGSASNRARRARRRHGVDEDGAAAAGLRFAPAPLARVRRTGRERAGAAAAARDPGAPASSAGPPSSAR